MAEPGAHAPGTQSNPVQASFRAFVDGAAASCVAEAISLPLEVAKVQAACYLLHPACAGPCSLFIVRRSCLSPGRRGLVRQRKDKLRAQTLASSCQSMQLGTQGPSRASSCGDH